MNALNQRKNTFGITDVNNATSTLKPLNNGAMNNANNAKNRINLDVESLDITGRGERFGTYGLFVPKLVIGKTDQIILVVISVL